LISLVIPVTLICITIRCRRGGEEEEEEEEQEEQEEQDKVSSQTHPVIASNSYEPLSQYSLHIVYNHKNKKKKELSVSVASFRFLSTFSEQYLVT